MAWGDDDGMIQGGGWPNSGLMAPGKFLQPQNEKPEAGAMASPKKKPVKKAGKPPGRGEAIKRGPVSKEPMQPPVGGMGPKPPSMARGPIDDREPFGGGIARGPVAQEPQVHPLPGAFPFAAHPMPAPMPGPNPVHPQAFGGFPDQNLLMHLLGLGIGR